MKDNNSLAHPTWDGRYHILFAPEDRRKIIYGKCRYGNRKFWCRGYYVNAVGRRFNNIREQLRGDYVADQLSLFEEYDPFTGQKNLKKK